MSVLPRKAILKRIREGVRILVDLSEGDSLKKEAEKILKLLDGEDGEEIEQHAKEIENFFQRFESEDSEAIEKFVSVVSNYKPAEKKELFREKKLPIFISNFKPKKDLLEPSNYNLRLGPDVYLTTERLPRKLTDTSNVIEIKPGEFGILTTYEHVYVPDDLLGLITLRFKYKSYGLVNISGFHVDPGYYGTIIFSVYNAGPKNIVLQFKEPLFMIMFAKLEEPVEKGYFLRKGSFGNKNIPTDMITSISGPSVSVMSLDAKIRSLEIRVRIFEALLIAVILGIIGILLR